MPASDDDAEHRAGVVIEQGSLFPEQVAWPVTGTHPDGTPCHHTDSHCKEHGSCIDCDLCKLVCECN